MKITADTLLKKNLTYSFLMLFLILQSCGTYKQNIMFQTNPELSYSNPAKGQNKNYVIQVNDYLNLQVFTQNGERIIDPDFALSKEIQNVRDQRPSPRYIVRSDGQVKLPMVGVVEVEGKTLAEAERELKSLYTEYYTDPFVILNYLNKRVIVLGNSGGLVVPIENENTKVSEILAISQAIDNNAKSHNIRLVRNEQVYVLDFSTVEKALKSNMVVEPEDIIYVEPVRRPFNEFFRDNGPVINVVTGLVTLFVLILSINN